MAIQMRRGKYELLDPSKLMPGEWAIVLESDPNGTGGRSLYMCFSPGVVKRIATVDDMATIIANAEPEVSANIMKIATDTNAAITDAEKKRVAAENSRVSAESARETKQASNNSAQTSNNNAQSSNNSKQTSNNSAQSSNNTAQAKNNADQAQNNAAAKGMTFSILSSSQYAKTTDNTHNKPTITGKTGVMYLTPRISGATDDDKYDQWMYLNSAWELMGETGSHVDPVTTSDIDSITSGTSITADRYLNATGLTYWWAKAKSALSSVFAAKSHTHTESQVTNLSTDLSNLSSRASSLESRATSLEANVTSLKKSMPIYYYSSAPTESTVKSEHAVPCLVVVKGGATYLVE